MATIEEQLIGFQVVRTLNNVQNSTLAMAGRLSAAKDEKEAIAEKEQAIAVSSINEKILTRLNDFLNNYPGGEQKLVRSYQAMGVTARQVRDETDNMVSIQASAKEALANAKVTQKDISAIGNQAHEAVEGHISEIADVELHYEHIQMHVCCWDLVNVVAITLQGVSQGSGKPLENDSVETRKAIVARHMLTFSRSKKYLNANDEDAVNFAHTMDIVKDSIDGCTTLEQLNSLGKLVDVRVSRAPLIRRAWQYGQAVRNNPR